MTATELTLSYSGANSDNHELDLYDAGRALVGFQRSLALTVHAIINDEVITKATNLKGARIFSVPPADGSWKINATVIIVATGVYNVTTVSKDTVLGHIILSAYDYVIHESLGFHVDFNKTLLMQYNEQNKEKSKTNLQSRLDSVIDKTGFSIRDMHRPIVVSGTASEAVVIGGVGAIKKPLSPKMNSKTFEYINFTKTDDKPSQILGMVSSYNINTYKGRVFIADEGRTIPFELADSAKMTQTINVILHSLTANAQQQMAGEAVIKFIALKNLSRSGQIKSFYIIEAEKN